MEFLRLKEDIEKFQNADDITIEAILGIFQDVFRDIRIKFDKSPEMCSCINATDLASKLIWFTNQLSKIEEQNRIVLAKEGRLKRFQAKEQELELELQKYSAQEKKVKDAETRIALLEKEITKKKESVSGIRGIMDNLHQREETYQKLVEEETVLSGKKKNLEEQVASFRKINIQQLENEIKDLLRESSAQQVRQEELSKKKERLDGEKEKAENSIRALNEKITVLESDIQEKKRLAEKLEIKKQELLKGAAEFNEQEQQYQILCESVSSMEGKIDDLKKCIAERNPYERQLKEEEKRLAAQASELQIAIVTLTERNPQLKAQNEENESRAAQLGDERQVLEEEQKKLNGEIEKLNKEISDFKILTKPMLDSRLQTVQNEKEQLEEKQKHLQKQIEAKNLEIAKTAEKIKELNAEFQVADTRLKEKRNEQERILNAIESVNSTISQLTREIADMENSLKEKNASDLQTALEQKKRDLKKMLSDYNQTYMELEEERNRLSILEKDTMEKKQQLAEKQEQHAKIQEEYHKAVESLSILARKDDEIMKMEQQLKGFRQIEATLREQSEILSIRIGGGAFVLAEELQQALTKTEKSISAFREAIAEFAEITRKQLEELS